MVYQLGVRDFLECTWHPRLLFCLWEQGLRLESIGKGDHQEGSEEEAAVRDQGWRWQGLIAELLSRDAAWPKHQSTGGDGTSGPYRLS